MGAWGVKTFENDYALDWINALRGKVDKRMIINSLMEIDMNESYIEAPECSEALCVIELIAKSKPKLAVELPDEVSIWLNKKHGLFRRTISFSQQESELAIRILERIKLDSELKELWEESEYYQEWLTYLEELELMFKS